MPFHYQHDLALPKGSTILVTGSSGFLASNIVHEILKAGFQVLGTSRLAPEKERIDDRILGSPNYETIEVRNIDEPGAFDAAVRGVDAIIHTATPLSLSADPSEVVGPAVAAVVPIMTSALQEPSVKRFVYASSSIAATQPKVNQPMIVNKDSWNRELDDWVTKKWNPYLIYAASKVMSELAVWDFVKEHRPDFAVNTVC